jgi:thiamine transport system permease protein
VRPGSSLFLYLRFLKFILLVFGFLWPAYYLFQSLSPDFWHLLVASSTIYTVVQTLFWSSLALAIIAVLAVPLALWLHQNKNSRFRRLVSMIRLFFQITWVLPGFVFAFVTLFALKICGVVDLYSMKSVLVAWVLAGTPFVATGLLVVLDDLDPREVEGMQSLGAHGFQMSRFYFLPKIRASLASVLFHQAWLLLTSFSVVVLLNGGPPHETLEVAIYTSVRMDHVDYNAAVALVVWQMVILAAIRAFLTRRKTELKTGTEWRSFQSSKQVVPIRLFFNAALFFTGPVLLMFGHGDLLGALLTSFFLSTMVALSSIALALALYYSKSKWLAELSAWTSPMVLALAWWKAYAFTFPAFLICIAIQTVLFTPWVSRILFPLFDRTRTPELHAMQSLGAPPLKAWLGVEWPRLKKDFKVVAAWIFGLSMCEVSSVILFSRGDFEPLSVWVQNEFSRFHLDEAARGTLLLVFYSVLMIMWAKDEKSARRV